MDRGTAGEEGKKKLSLMNEHKRKMEAFLPRKNNKMGALSPSEFALYRGEERGGGGIEVSATGAEGPTGNFIYLLLLLPGT